MKFVVLVLWLVLSCIPEPVSAQNTTADENASCQAIFHRFCSSETSAAPAPIIGAGIGEVGLLVLAGVYRWHRRRRRIIEGGGVGTPSGGM